MPCTFPLQGYFPNPGCRPMFLKMKHNNFLLLTNSDPDKYKWLPCRQCKHCRLERSRQWAIRCYHEASLHKKNCFITLTYDEDHLPADYSLDKEEMPLFMKRLREYAQRKYGHVGIRFFQAGEYGDKFKRPHYHILLFNWDFPDKQLYKEVRGYKYYISKILSKLWTKGFCIIADLTFQSAAYVARYCCKKVTGKAAEEFYTVKYDGDIYFLEPEHCTMSRKPGIGARWIGKFGKWVYNDDSVVLNGVQMKPPKFYDTLYKQRYPDNFVKIQSKRKMEASSKSHDMTRERLDIKALKKDLDTKKLIRGYERGEL